VGDGFFVADSATGPVTFFFGDDSTFLLRLRRGARSDVVPGAVVAVLGEPVGTARVEARSILVLPSESRPVIQGPDLFAFGGGGDGEAGGAARDGDGENSDAGSAEDAAAGDALVDDEMADAGTSDAASDDSQDLDAGDLGTTEGESESAELEMGPDTDDATGTGEPGQTEADSQSSDEETADADDGVERDPATSEEGGEISAPSQPEGDGVLETAVDFSGLLEPGEQGRLGSLAFRLQLVVVSTGPDAGLSAQLLVTNESSSAATTPALVATCQTGAEGGAPSGYRVGQTLPPGTLLTARIRFGLPANCGAVVVEARLGEESLGWGIAAPERQEAASIAEQPDALRAALETERRRYGLTGTSLAVAAPGLDVWSGGSGLADRGDDRPMDSDSVFRIGELTQMFVAIVAPQLVEEGVLELDASLGEAFPDVPKSERMTLRQLLSHTSGINSFKIRPFAAAFFGDQTQTWAPAGVLSFLNPLNVDEPGEGWDHSGTNYLLIADLVQQATGIPIEEQVQRRLLDPLNLSATGWIDPESPPEQLVASYSRLGANEIDQEIFTALETGFRPAMDAGTGTWRSAQRGDPCRNAGVREGSWRHRIRAGHLRIPERLRSGPWLPERGVGKRGARVLSGESRCGCRHSGEPDRCPNKPSLHGRLGNSPGRPAWLKPHAASRFEN